MNKLLPILALALVASGCNEPDFEDPMNVSKLRVLGLRADPPEVAAPGDASAPSAAALTALVAHPAFATDAARRATVLHLACTPSPGSAGMSPCTALSELSDPTVLLGLADLALACTAPGLGKPDAITLAGLESCGAAGCEPVQVRRDPVDPGSTVALPAPGYEVPAAASLAGLPAGHPDRVNGGEIVDLALVLDAAPADLAPQAAVGDGCEALAAVAQRFLARWQASPGVATLKRLRLRGPDAPSSPNQNPALTGIALAGATLPAPGAAPAAIAGGAKHGLLPVLPGAPDALAETWIETDSEGKQVRERKEEWAYAWFTTAGEMKEAYTNRADEPLELTAPSSGPLLVWLVVRDLRGGMAWKAASLVAGN